MGIIGVTFGDKHSYYDWHVYLDGGLQIEYPTPRRITVDVALRNGLLDVTSALTDRILYESRKITANFKIIDNPLPWQDVYSKIAGDVHGKALHIIYDLDPDFYWDAYDCIVNTPTASEDVGSISITCTCYPFKKERIEKSVVQAVTGDVNSYVDLTIENLREEISPTIRCTADARIRFNGGTRYELSTGDNILSDVALIPGTNVLRLIRYNSNVTFTITYRRGEL